MFELLASFLRKRFAISMRHKNAAIRITPPWTSARLREWQDDFISPEPITSVREPSAIPNPQIPTLKQTYPGGRS